MISGIGVFIFLYAGAYMAGHPQFWRFFLYLGGFMLAMLGLVTADNLIALFVFWELTSVTSYLLIGFNHEDAESRRKALQALIVTGAGGLAMLAGFLVLGLVGGSFEISELDRIAVQQSELYVPILVLVLLGAFTKSAQFPFHFLAAQRHGGADPGQRLPAQRDHGQGRHLPAGPAAPDAGRDRPVGLDADDLRRDHGGLGVGAGAQADRPEGDAGGTPR